MWYENFKELKKKYYVEKENKEYWELDCYYKNEILEI